MVSFNRVIVAGNLTRNPELRVTQSGIPVCDFGIAVNRVRSKNDEVDFFDVSAWRELGETIANYKQKGDAVLVEGRLQYRTWEAQDGSKRSKVDITADNVQFLSNAGGRQDQPGHGAQQRNQRDDNGGSGSRVQNAQQEGQKAARANRATAQPGTSAVVRDDVDESDFDDIPF